MKEAFSSKHRYHITGYTVYQKREDLTLPVLSIFLLYFFFFLVGDVLPGCDAV
jgi:hypothetical protein